MEPTVNPLSSPSYRSDLDLFSMPTTDVSIFKAEKISVQPRNSVTSANQVIEFQIEPTPHYIDLYHSSLYLKGKVLNGSESLTSTNECAISNFFPLMFFKNMQVYVNNVKVFDAYDSLPYSTIIPLLLTTNSDTKTSALSTLINFEDTEMEKLDSSNLGYTTRKKLISGSKVFECSGKIPISIFNNVRLLPPNTSIRILLTRSKPEFHLDSPDSNSSYNVTLESAVFHYVAQVVNPSIVKHHQMLMQSTCAKYVLQNPTVFTAQLPIGTTHYTSEPLFSVNLPSVIILGLVSNDQFTGTFKTSALNFKPHALSSISLRVDGEEKQEYVTDYQKDLYMSAYQGLSKASRNFSIPYHKYTAGYCLYYFEVTPISTTSALQPERFGGCKVELKFASAITSSINLVALGLFENRLTIGADRAVSID